MTDLVNHPPHYNSHPSGVECITIVRHMTFNLGNAVKYIWRAGLKSPDALTDLKKAEFYIKNEIARLEEQGVTKIAEIVDRAVPRHDPISPPPHWGNGRFQKEETNR